MAYPIYEQKKDSTYDSRYANPPQNQLTYVGEYAQFPKVTRNQPNCNIYGASTISIMQHDHRHEYGTWAPNLYVQASKRFPNQQPPPPPFPPPANTPNRVQEPANRILVITKTSTPNDPGTQPIPPKYNPVSPTMQIQKIADTGMKFINTGILPDQSKNSTTKNTVSKDSSKTSRFKDYTTKIKNNLKSSSNKPFSIEDFKSTAWDASSMCRKPEELFRADGEFSKILRTQIKKSWSDWLDGIINSEVKACMKKHAEALTSLRRNIEAMYQKQKEQAANASLTAAICNAEARHQEQKEQAVNELLNLILGNVRASLKLGNKAPMPDDCKSILSCMNRIAIEKFPEEKSTRAIVFNRFLFRYIIPNLAEPDQLPKNIPIESFLQIQQELSAKLSNEPKCPDFLVPIFI